LGCPPHDLVIKMTVEADDHNIHFVQPTINAVMVQNQATL
jgi:hypothetical protein